MDTTVTGWGEALWVSLAGAMAGLFSALPRVLGFIVILIVGWIISGLIAGGVAALLRAVRFNDLANRAGVTGFVQNMGIRTDAAGFLGDLVRWFVRLIVLVVAFDALGLPAVSQVLQQFLLWMPNLVVALVILVIAGLGANALANLVRGATAEAGLSNPQLLATIARVAVWCFGIVVAVNQLGIAETLVNTLFMGLVGALALALGLAFGFGGRETAAEIVQSWYRQGQEAGPKLDRAAVAAKRQVDATAEQVSNAASRQSQTGDERLLKDMLGEGGR
jgi:hypothetical protein